MSIQVTLNITPGTAAADGTVTKYTIAGEVNLSGPVTPIIPVPPSQTKQCIFGVWDPATVDWSTGMPVGTWNGVNKFSAAPVKSATYYAAWLSPQPTQLYSLAKQNSAKVYLNLEPMNTWGGGANPTFPDITSGRYDAYLTQVGQAIKTSGSEQWVTFAHEMNGNGWYPWQQSGGVSPTQWIAAWKHVCDVIRANAGGYAKMVWCPNNTDVGPCTPYWPSDDYVDVAGFDGYLNDNSPTLTYANFVKRTVDEIRTLTAKPIWNAETGVAPLGDRTQRYKQFIADMHADGLSGFTQWNQNEYALSTAEIQAVCQAVNAWNAA